MIRGVSLGSISMVSKTNKIEHIGSRHKWKSLTEMQSTQRPELNPQGALDAIVLPRGKEAGPSHALH